MDFVKCDYLGDGYLINKEGLIKSPKGKILKKSMSNSGYYFHNLNGKGRFLHRAICFAFVPLVEGKNIVNHKDGNKLNNSVDNLEWCTYSENNKHAFKTGLKNCDNNWANGKFGKDHNRSKAVICVQTGVEYGSMSEAGRLLKINYSSVSWSIKHNKTIFGMNFELKK